MTGRDEYDWYEGARNDASGHANLGAATREFGGVVRVSPWKFEAWVNLARSFDARHSRIKRVIIELRHATA